MLTLLLYIPVSDLHTIALTIKDDFYRYITRTTGELRYNDIIGVHTVSQYSIIPQWYYWRKYVDKDHIKRHSSGYNAHNRPNKKLRLRLCLLWGLHSSFWHAYSWGRYHLTDYIKWLCRVDYENNRQMKIHRLHRCGHCISPFYHPTWIP